VALAAAMASPSPPPNPVTRQHRRCQPSRTPVRLPTPHTQWHASQPQQQPRWVVHHTHCGHHHYTGYVHSKATGTTLPTTTNTPSPSPHPQTHPQVLGDEAAPHCGMAHSLTPPPPSSSPPSILEPTLHQPPKDITTHIRTAPSPPPLPPPRHQLTSPTLQVLGDEAAPHSGMAHSLSSGSITLVSGAAQWQGVMAGVPPTTLLVAMFGLSTDSVCQATAAAVQVRGLLGWIRPLLLVTSAYGRMIAVATSPPPP